MAMIAGIIGAGLSAAGAMQAGQAQAQQAEMQAGIADRNAALARAEARNRAAASREQYRRLGESQKAAFAANNIALDSGTVLATLADTDAENEIAAMELLYGGEMEATNLKNQAVVQRHQARAARTAGQLGAASSLLSFGGSMLGGKR